MRHLVFGFLILLLLPTATFADDTAFGRQLYRHLMENSWVFSEGLRNKAAKVGVVLSIDRDGKLLNAAVDQSSGSTEDDEAALAGLRRIQSFPRVPDDLQAPFEIKTTFNFGQQGHIAYIDLKWPPMVTTTPGQEISFRSDLLHHVRVYPRILPDDMKKPSDNHSIVDFSIDRDGKLANAKITKSSGSKKVDDETLAWLRRIQPFPKIPAELKAPMKLTAEIVFGPKGYDEEARRKISGVCRGC